MTTREKLEEIKTLAEDALEAADGKTNEQRAFDLVVDDSEIDRALDVMQDLASRIDCEIEIQRINS